MAPVPKDSQLSILRYSPKCVKGEFSEVQIHDPAYAVPMGAEDGLFPRPGACYQAQDMGEVNVYPLR